jgi:exoribonuclease-2
MYVLFEDAGKFQAGRVMSDAQTSVQVELDSGKRVKVKAAHVMLRFERPAPGEFLAAARALAEDIDLDLAWEFAPEGEFGFAALAQDYFSADAGHTQQAAALIRLHEAPHYFRRAGKGLFRKAPEETVKAALLAIERKREQQALVDEWAASLAQGQCPDAVREQIYRILFKPDKNALEYKAVVEAARRAHRAPLDLLKEAGALASPYQFHWRRFLFEQFPQGADFPALDVPALADPNLPVATVRAFSIDDSHTTEIDDALSVQGLGSGQVTLGIHIAAPGLALQPGTAADAVARARLSTVYMPGWKLTMLPQAIVEAYTLQEGRDCPAVSLYVTFDEASLAIVSRETRLERVPVVANLRHDQLDTVVTEAALTGVAPATFDFAEELTFGFRLARHLKAERERVRGKPEVFNRPDYVFRLARDEASAEPTGEEAVNIGVRQRGAPLDLIVAEAMILANSSWGDWLAQLGVPAIYRSQASLAPGIKVRMGTRALPHAGMGVSSYAWSTSPLRRYVDLVNQWQIIACARHGNTAALAASFKPKDATLLAIVSNFDAAYTAYNGFQQAIERFWTLRWLEQQAVTSLEASVLHDALVRADTVPLVFRVPGTESLPRGAKVRARITGVDLLTLELHAALAERLDVQGGGAPAGQTAAEDDEDEDTASAQGLRVNITLDDANEEDAAHGARVTHSQADPQTHAERPDA